MPRRIQAKSFHFLNVKAVKPLPLEYGRRFRSTLERLIDLPETGAPRQSLGPNVRIGIVSPYILI
jgi:hypothetical protein